jgi:hypothetical protein
LWEDRLTENLKGIKLMFVPCAEYMSDQLQKKLAELISGGMIIVFVGVLPKFNMKFKPSRVLAKYLGIQTRISYGPGDITTDNHSFRSLVYGYIQSKGSAKIIARSGTKTVGLTKKSGKGKYYYFTYDIGASGEPGRLSFLKDILVDNKITTPVSCSETDIDVVVRSNDRGAILFLINAGSWQLIRHTRKKVVVAVDLSQIGFRQAKIVLHDVFNADNKIKTTSQELRDGLIFEMDHLDARIYWIPKK